MFVIFAEDPKKQINEGTPLTDACRVKTVGQDFL